MSAFTVRRATAADLAAIRSVHELAVRRICALDYAAAEIEAWVGGPRADPNPDETRWVATAGGAVVGFSALLGDEVCAVYVHPDWLRRGVGSALLREAEQKASLDGVSRVRLDASLGAVPFYTANGYRTIRETTHLLGGRVPIRCVQMDKDWPTVGHVRPTPPQRDPPP